MNYIKLIYLTVYNRFIYKYDYDKDSVRVAKFNFAASSANMGISVAIMFLLAYSYKAIFSVKFPPKIPTSALFPFLCCYFLLYLYFQKYNDLDELYDNYLDLPENNRKKWKIITVLFFISCFLVGLIPPLNRWLY